MFFAFYLTRNVFWCFTKTEFFRGLVHGLDLLGKLALFDLPEDVLGRLISCAGQSTLEGGKELLQPFKQSCDHARGRLGSCAEVSKRISDGFFQNLCLGQAKPLVGIKASHDLAVKLSHLPLEVLVYPSLLSLLLQRLPLLGREEPKFL